MSYNSGLGLGMLSPTTIISPSPINVHWIFLDIRPWLKF